MELHALQCFFLHLGEEECSNKEKTTICQNVSILLFLSKTETGKEEGFGILIQKD